MEVELGLTKSFPPVASGGSYLLLVRLKLFFVVVVVPRKKLGELLELEKCLTTFLIFILNVVWYMRTV